MPVLFSLSYRDETLVSFSGLTFTRSGRNGADIHTHTHTHEPNTVTLAAHARRGLTSNGTTVCVFYLYCFVRIVKSELVIFFAIVCTFVKYINYCLHI